MYAVSWSGGKDACLAMWKALQKGYQVSHLLTFVETKTQEIPRHGIKFELIKKQAESMNLPCVKMAWPDGLEGGDIEETLKKTLRSLIPQGLKGLIRGDISFSPLKTLMERISKELGIELMEPLWGMRSEDIVEELLSNKFEAIIASAPLREGGLGIDREWIGRPFNRDFIRYLQTKPNIDIAGEKGEFHTIVVNGPLFRHKIATKQGPVTEKEYVMPPGRHYFAEISPIG